jgi:hypothetical protein
VIQERETTNHEKRTMRTTTTTTTSLLEIARETVSDFVLGALPTIAALGGIAALFLVPLFLLARSVGAL